MAFKNVALRKKKIRLQRRRKHIRKVVRGTAERPRLVVFRSNRHIYAQIVDDFSQSTITGCSTLTPELLAAVKTLPKTKQASIVGAQIAKMAIEKGINRVCFDRNGCDYHGRVKSVADGARKAGLII